MEAVVKAVVKGEKPRSKHLAGLRVTDLKKEHTVGMSRALKAEVKKTILNESDSADSVTEALFYCTNCHTSEPIVPGTILYHKDYTDTNEGSDIEYSVHDPATGRTRVYICPNGGCSTHSKPEKREAILRKDKLGLLHYICTVCHHRWRPGF